MNLELFITNWLSDWTGNDPDRLITYYSDDAFYLDPANPQGLTGKNQIRPYLVKLLSKNPNWMWSPVEIIENPKGCTLKWLATIPIGIELLKVNGLDIIEISESQISRNEVFFDTHAWMKLLGK